MARITPAKVEQYGPLFGEDAPLRLQMYAHWPEIAKAYVEFSKALSQYRTLPNRLVELLRLRIAYWNQCRSCMALRYEDAMEDGLTEALVCSLERPEEAEGLTPAERSAIAFADMMATDHRTISDETFDQLREHFDERQILELCFTIARFVGFGRMAAVLDMVDDLPERYRGDEEVAPWGGDEDSVILIRQ